jgi:hypothetical protein
MGRSGQILSRKNAMRDFQFIADNDGFGGISAEVAIL